MNLSKEHFDMYNEYTLNINKIKREVNAIIKRQRFTARRCKRASEEEILDLEINKYEEVESINKKKIPSKIYEFSNGDIYIGKIVNGKMDGIGTYNFVEGIEYIGEFKNDMKNGLGMCTFKSGNIYIGNFLEDTINGMGQMVYKSKDEYMGNWLDGKKHGKGIYIWRDNSMYIGEFKNNKMDVYWVCYDCHGNIIYEWEWKNNLVHGKGTYIWEEGKRYEGEFLHGKKHGDGTFYLNNELVYEGTWKFDKPCIFDRSLDEIFAIKL